MMQSVQKIERNIKERIEVDVPLINWWLNILIVTPVTLGIYSIILFFKKTSRVDKFIIRKKEYYQNVIEYTERFAQEKGTYDDTRNEIEDLKFLMTNAFNSKIKEIKGGISFLLTIVTFGIWAFIWMYKMNKVWDDLQKLEQEFDDKVSQIWLKLELTKYPINFNINSSKKRSFVLYLILSTVTFGIWGLVWDYKIHTDPDNLYKEFHQVEDTILNTVRNN